jgi:hypothetical protein
MLAGAMTCLVGAIMFLIVAFEESALWGLACLLLWPFALLFLVFHVKEATRPVLVELAGGGLCALGMMVMERSA